MDEGKWPRLELEADLCRQYLSLEEVRRFWLKIRRIVTNSRELRPILGNFGLKNWRFLTRAPARPRGAKGKKQQQKLTRQQLELQLAEEEVRIPNHFDLLTRF